MIIHTLELETAQLGSLLSFYRNTLNLKVSEESNGGFSFQTGPTRVRFIEAAKGTQPFYHFAFNIPENQLALAKGWAEQRVKLLEFKEEDVIHFEFSNAHAIYFYDPAGNIVEFIARHDMDNASSLPFGPNSILEVSEIGLPVPDVARYAANVRDGIGQPVWDKSSINDVLTFIGDEDGMFIVVKEGRDWLMTKDPARPWPVKAFMSGKKPFRFTDDDKGYELVVEEG